MTERPEWGRVAHFPWSKYRVVEVQDGWDVYSRNYEMGHTGQPGNGGLPSDCPHEFWDFGRDGKTFCRACGVETTGMEAMGS